MQHKETSAALLRHVEDGGDDEDHLLRGIEHDLASMIVNEFTPPGVELWSAGAAQ